MSVGITSVDRGGVEVYKCEYETASFTYARTHARTRKWKRQVEHDGNKEPG